MRFKLYFIQLPNGKIEVRAHNYHSIFSSEDVQLSNGFVEWIHEEWQEKGWCQI